MFRSDHDPKPDVELTLVNQQWLFNVFLENKYIWLHICVYDRAALRIRLRLGL